MVSAAFAAAPASLPSRLPRGQDGLQQQGLLACRRLDRSEHDLADPRRRRRCPPTPAR